MVNDAPAKTPLKSQFFFPQFPHLPKEIRLLIWEHALPKPRVIYLEQRFLRSIIRPRVRSDESIHGPVLPSPSLRPSPQGGLGARGFRSRSPTPALMLVNRESHDFMRTHYSKAFGSRYSFPETWFDFERDTLLVDWGWDSRTNLSSSKFSLEGQDRVRNLAMLVDPVDGEPEELIAYNLRCLGKVKVLSVLDGDRDVPKVDEVDIGRLALVEMSELHSDEQLERWRRSRKQTKRSKIQERRDRRFGDWNANYEIPDVVKHKIAIVVRGE